MWSSWPSTRPPRSRARRRSSTVSGQRARSRTSWEPSRSSSTPCRSSFRRPPWRSTPRSAPRASSSGARTWRTPRACRSWGRTSSRHCTRRQVRGSSSLRSRGTVAWHRSWRMRGTTSCCDSASSPTGWPGDVRRGPCTSCCPASPRRARRARSPPRRARGHCIWNCATTSSSSSRTGGRNRLGRGWTHCSRCGPGNRCTSCPRNISPRWSCPAATARTRRAARRTPR
mmetsp:Transcript_13265/g.39543  ORF Transcript_13265/g.39543 Transcript_13265/m.39543 type:complete len:228 (+) Transcript_13265:449-1132(+)